MQEEETVGVEVAVGFSNFNSKRVELRCLWIVSRIYRCTAGAPEQIWQQYLMQGQMVDLQMCKDGSWLEKLFGTTW